MKLFSHFFTDFEKTRKASMGSGLGKKRKSNDGWEGGFRKCSENILTQSYLSTEGHMINEKNGNTIRFLKSRSTKLVTIFKIVFRSYTLFI